MALPRVPATRAKSIERAPAEPRQSRRDEVVASLARLEGLAGLPLRRLHFLADRMVIRLFKRHAVIYAPDKPRECIYVLLSGIARLTFRNRKGQRVLLEILGPGDIVALPPMLTDERAHLQFGAFSDCRIGLIGPKILIQGVLGLQFDHFRRALALSSGKWWQLLVRHSVFIEQTLQKRVILALLDLGAKVGEARKKTFIIDLTHQDLAELVMGSRAKVSTCLKQLAAQNAITQEGRTRLVIVPRKLQAIAGF